MFFGFGFGYKGRGDHVQKIGETAAVARAAAIDSAIDSFLRRSCNCLSYVLFLKLLQTKVETIPSVCNVKDQDTIDNTLRNM